MWRHDVRFGSTRVSSTHLLLFSASPIVEAAHAYSNFTPSRVVPHPSAYRCLKCCPKYFVLQDCQLKLPFQLPVFNLFSGTKVDQNIQELMSKLAKCWNTSWWLSVSPRQTSHGHLFDVSHEVINESKEIVWGNNQVAKETQPSNRPEESDWTTKGIRDSVGEFRLESNKK